MLLVTLHGFWGEGSDFSALAFRLRQQKVIDRWWGPQLLNKGILGPQWGLQEWPRIFFQELEQKKKSPQEEVIALGYSMGGRLLLHALKTQPHFFKKAIIISAQTHLSDHEQIQKRKLWEMSWELSFQKKTWSDLWCDWNHLEVLKSPYERAIPKEKRYSRCILRQALRNWSPTLHFVNADDFTQFPIPLLWVAGERDRKYAQLYTSWRESGTYGQVEIVPEAGHRVHMDQAELLSLVVSSFIGA